MDELLVALFSALDGFFKSAADRRRATAQIIREALAERVAAPGRPAAEPGAAGSRRSRGGPVVVSGATLPEQAPDPRGVVNTARPVPASPIATEAVLVRRIFANPQSVAAAFIAAEVFAKPVALRDR